jgi:hypothetical protein
MQPPESPRVRELSQRIQELIRDFQRQYPMTSTEIRQALLHASGTAGGDRRPLLVVALASVVAALGVGVFASRAGQGSGESGPFPIMVVLAVVAAMAGIILAIKRRQ